VSAWEIAIRRNVGAMKTPDDLPRQLQENRFVSLEITLDHALAVAGLPPHHGDPFDRMLIAQAQLESLTVVTSDRKFPAYGVAVLPA
jgi:PIN domain nuclease of toxin-antitoxin system